MLGSVTHAVGDDSQQDMKKMRGGGGLRRLLPFTYSRERERKKNLEPFY